MLRTRREVDLLEFSCHAIFELFLSLAFLNSAILIGKLKCMCSYVDMIYWSIELLCVCVICRNNWVDSDVEL